MNLKHLIISIVILINFALCSAYRILCVFPYNANSHNIVFQALMKGLAEKGHQVDVITHFTLKKPIKNYNNIIHLNETDFSYVNNVSFEEIKTKGKDLVQVIVQYHGNEFCHIMGLEKFQKLIKSPPTDPPYDLIITEVSINVKISSSI